MDEHSRLLETALEERQSEVNAMRDSYEQKFSDMQAQLLQEKEDEVRLSITRRVFLYQRKRFRFIYLKVMIVSDTDYNRKISSQSLPKH